MSVQLKVNKPAGPMEATTWDTAKSTTNWEHSRPGLVTLIGKECQLTASFGSYPKR